MARPRGSKNEKTLQWEAFGKVLLDEGLPRLVSLLQNSDDETFLRIYIPLLEFFKPKLKRIEEVKESESIEVRVIWDEEAAVSKKR